MPLNYSRSRASNINATRGGNGSPAQGGMRGDGEEVGGVGSIYAAVLNERMNKSLNRNAGPAHPSANTGTIANVSMASRNTGRVG